MKAKTDSWIYRILQAHDVSVSTEIESNCQALSVGRYTESGNEDANTLLV